MKNVTRAFVIALTLTGAFASAGTSGDLGNLAQAGTSTRSLMPVPVCPPNDPNACGWAK